jgi:hypothetical protein
MATAGEGAGMMCANIRCGNDGPKRCAGCGQAWYVLFYRVPVGALEKGWPQGVLQGH